MGNCVYLQSGRVSQRYLRERGGVEVRRNEHHKRYGQGGKSYDLNLSISYEQRQRRRKYFLANIWFWREAEMWANAGFPRRRNKSLSLLRSMLVFLIQSSHLFVQTLELWYLPYIRRGKKPNRLNWRSGHSISPTVNIIIIYSSMLFQARPAAWRARRWKWTWAAPRRSWTSSRRRCSRSTPTRTRGEVSRKLKILKKYFEKTLKKALFTGNWGPAPWRRFLNPKYDLNSNHKSSQKTRFVFRKEIDILYCISPPL